MHWRQNRIIPLSANLKKQEALRLKRAKRLNIILVCIVVGGFILIGMRMISHERVSAVQIDFQDQNGTLRKWTQSGFIKSMDDAAGTLIVNEAQWNDLSQPQKEGIVIFLRSYYAHQSGTKESTVCIRGDVSRQLLFSTETVSISGK